MRHLKHRHQLGRKKEHRQALMANMSAQLLTHGRIETTLPKAKALRPFVEKVITLAKKAHEAPTERSLHLRRQALAKVRDRAAVAKLFNERATEFVGRNGGYTRIYKLGQRVGDAAEMAIITLIEAGDEGYTKSRRKATAKAAEAPAPAAEETPAEEPAGAPEGEPEAEAAEKSDEQK